MIRECQTQYAMSHDGLISRVLLAGALPREPEHVELARGGWFLTGDVSGECLSDAGLAVGERGIAPQMVGILGGRR